MKNEKHFLKLLLVVAVAMTFGMISSAVAQEENSIVSYDITQNGDVQTLTFNCNVNEGPVQWVLQIVGSQDVLLGGVSETGEFSVKIPDIKSGDVCIFSLGTADNPSSFAREIIKI